MNEEGCQDGDSHHGSLLIFGPSNTESVLYISIRNDRHAGRYRCRCGGGRGTLAALQDVEDDVPRMRLVEDPFYHKDAQKNSDGLVMDEDVCLTALV